MDTDQTMEIGECHIEVELSIDRIMNEGYTMIKITEMTLTEEILEECKIIGRILEADIEVTLEMKTLKEVKVGLEKDCI